MMQACEEGSLVLWPHTHSHHGQRLLHEIIAPKQEFARFWLKQIFGTQLVCTQTTQFNLPRHQGHIRISYASKHSQKKLIALKSLLKV
jgi:aspartate/methionine/tyrosine aminotransferase